MQKKSANFGICIIVSTSHIIAKENSITFQDLSLKFPGPNPYFQDYSGPGNFTHKKSRTFQEAWEPCGIDRTAEDKWQDFLWSMSPNQQCQSSDKK